MMFNKKVNHTKSPPENSFSGGFLIDFLDTSGAIAKFPLTSQRMFELYGL